MTTSRAVNRVAIIGGTHGNEANGVHLAKHFLRNPKVVKRSSFETEVHLANTKAIAANTRYVDEDLNRCFSAADLEQTSKAPLNWERMRARELNDILGPKGSANPRCDFVIDLHNTTAAVGISLLMSPDDDFSHAVAHHLMSLDGSVRIVTFPGQMNKRDYASVLSICRSGLTFEVGPCPWGCLMPDAFLRSAKLIEAALDYVERHNKQIQAGATDRQAVSMPVFRLIPSPIAYPCNEEGDILGMVHQDVQGQDFCEIKDGDNLFQLFSGGVKTFSRKEYGVPEELGQVFSFFVNEAAYYEKNFAMMLACREQRTIFVLSMLSKL